MMEHQFKLPITYCRIRQHLLRNGFKHTDVILFNTELEHVTRLFEVEFNCYINDETEIDKDGNQYIQKYVYFRSQEDLDKFAKEYP